MLQVGNYTLSLDYKCVEKDTRVSRPKYRVVILKEYMSFIRFLLLLL